MWMIDLALGDSQDPLTAGHSTEESVTRAFSGHPTWGAKAPVTGTRG